jgi:hypothetical protein
MKPNKYVAGTEDEKYSLITEMLSAIIRKELQVVRPTKRAADVRKAGAKKYHPNQRLWLAPHAANANR